jgi:hypothetical protein
VGRHYVAFSSTLSVGTLLFIALALADTTNMNCQTRDIKEDEELAITQHREPLPDSVGGFKDHPKYVDHFFCHCMNRYYKADPTTTV